MSDDSVVNSPTEAILSESIPPWFKSSFSVDVNCVTVASLDGYIAIRNSSDPDQGVIIVSQFAFADLLGAAKAGLYDDLLAC